MPTISIVANFYNSEKYINKLIRSVRAQTFADWELVAVNDCSPGRDSEILHRWARKDCRIRVIDNAENLGIARSKQVGIEAARGEYITFSDGDDWFEKEALERLYAAAQTTGADLVVMEYFRAYPMGMRRRISLNLRPEDYDRQISHEEFIDRFYYIWLGGDPAFAPYWGKLYKSSKLKAFDFKFTSKEDTCVEDRSFTTHFFPTLDSFAFIQFPGYNWRWGGISAKDEPYDFYGIVSIIGAYARRYYSATDLVNHHKAEKAHAALIMEAGDMIVGILERLAFPLIRANADDSTLAAAIEKHIFTAQLTGEKCIFEKQPNNPYLVAIQNKDAGKLCELMRTRYHGMKKLRLKRRLLSLLPFLN